MKPLVLIVSCSTTLPDVPPTSDTAAKRMSMRIGVDSSAGAKSEIQTKCMEAEGLVDTTLSSQKIKAISERLGFKLCVS